MRVSKIGFLLFTILSVVLCDSTFSPDEEKLEVTSDDGSNLENKATSSTPMPVEIRISKIDDKNDLDANKDVQLDVLLLFKGMDDAENTNLETAGSSLDKVQTVTDQNDDIERISATPVNTKIDFGNLRRKGEMSPESNAAKLPSNVQFDYVKEEDSINPPPRFGQRSRALNTNSVKDNNNGIRDNSNKISGTIDRIENGIENTDRRRFYTNGIRGNRLRYGNRNSNNRLKTEITGNNNRMREETPILQLTQGGYKRPFQESASFRNRDISRPDSSEETQTVQESGETLNNNRQPVVPRINPQVVYTGLLPSEPNYPRGGPMQHVRPELNAQQQNNRILPNQIAPSGANQNGLINIPPMGFLNYGTPNFYSQFPGNNEISFTVPNNAPILYQSSSRNPYLEPSLLYQRGPQIQPQPFVVDQTETLQPQFPFTNLESYPNFDNSQLNSMGNVASFFNNPIAPTANSQFRFPNNFYAMNPNEGFQTPPMSILQNFQNSNQRFPLLFSRYPVIASPRNRQNETDQETDSDTSQEDKSTKDNDLTDNEERLSAAFGRRIPARNEEDIFIRYPENEAGYAVEENLPPKNGSQPSKEGPSISERNFPAFDPYENALNTLRRQRQNRTSTFMPGELFKDVSMDFGYQRPPNQMFVNYPNRNRELQPFPPSVLNSRASFNQITPPDRNYPPFLNPENRRINNHNLDETPLCAKKNDAIFCFEDEEYPRNDILYSANSNSYLMDRMSGTNLELDSRDFIERNTTGIEQNSEDYACATDTKYGTPLRAKNFAGSWRVIVQLEKFAQPLRLEVCRSKGDPCSYVENRIKTTCVQKYTHQRLLTWSAERGVFADVFKIPVACSCQILQVSEA